MIMPPYFLEKGEERPWSKILSLAGSTHHLCLCHPSVEHLLVSDYRPSYMASLPKILTDETSVLHGLCAHSPPELVYKECLKRNYYGFQLRHTAPHSTSTMDHELYCGKYESFTVKYEFTLLRYESTVKADMCLV